MTRKSTTTSKDLHKAIAELEALVKSFNATAAQDAIANARAELRASIGKVPSPEIAEREVELNRLADRLR